MSPITDQVKEKPIVLVCEPTNRAPYELVKDQLEVHFGRTDRKYTEEELIEAIKDASAVVITSRDDITRTIMDHAPKLKIVCKGGAIPSPLKVDRDAATEKGIYVTWTPNTTTLSVAEHAVTLMLSLLKRVPLVMNQLRHGMWRNDMGMTEELSGKTVGIIGMGRIGRKTAELLAPFACKIYYYDPFLPGEVVGAERAELDFIIKNCEVISLHGEYNEKTRHMIDEAQLRSMRQNAILINTSRGGLINEAALYKALKERWIAGAALDVFEEEPPDKGNMLFSLPNIIVTSHMAGWTYESVTRSVNMSIQNILKVVHGETPDNVVNAEVIKKAPLA